MKPFFSRWAGKLMSAFFFMALVHTQAQTTVVSSVPASGATGVSANADVVITFSAAMNPSLTMVEFIDTTTFSQPNTVQAWSAGNTVLTCTPNPPFTAGDTIEWVVTGQDAQGNQLGGLPFGTFTVAGSGGTTGNGSTNEYSAFSVIKGDFYLQTLTGAPSPSTNELPYTFFAVVNLSSNQTATNVTITLPDEAVSNLFPFSFAPWQYTFMRGDTNQAALDSLFGNGNYVFNVENASSNEQMTVNLPASLAQPAPPHISNFAAAQSVDPTKPFTLTWDAFAGGTDSDYILVNVQGAFTTPTIGASNALKGTETSVVIPANTFTGGNIYDANVGFFHFVGTTNKTAKYVKAAVRYTWTEFNLVTSSGTTPPPGPINMSSFSLSNGKFSFTLTSDIGQVLSLQYATSVNGPWQTLTTKTNTTGSVTASDSSHTSNAQGFYRVQSSY